MGKDEVHFSTLKILASRILGPESQMSSECNLFHEVEGGYFGMGSKDQLFFLHRSLLIEEVRVSGCPHFLLLEKN